MSLLGVGFGIGSECWVWELGTGFGCWVLGVGVDVGTEC